MAGLPPELESGVYFGWASVDRGPIHKMVMSIGWNPQYQNEKRSMVWRHEKLIPSIERVRITVELPIKDPSRKAQPPNKGHTSGPPFP